MHLVPFRWSRTIVLLSQLRWDQSRDQYCKQEVFISLWVNDFYELFRIFRQVNRGDCIESREPFCIIHAFWRATTPSDNMQLHNIWNSIAYLIAYFNFRTHRTRSLLENSKRQLTCTQLFHRKKSGTTMQYIGERHNI